MGTHPDGLSSEGQRQVQRMRETGRKVRARLEKSKEDHQEERKDGDIRDSAARAADLGTRQENADPGSVAFYEEEEFGRRQEGDEEDVGGV